jgi:alpha-tubulin suppressor-like RCC1 family protein
MLHRTVTALVTSALLGAALLIAPAPSVAASGNFIASTITGGDSHTCGLTTTGDAYCWGRNDEGQIGDGTEDTDRLAPTRVAGNLKFTSITASRHQTCALTAIGAAYCWGYNADGALGNGTTDNKLTPTAVSGSLKFRMVISGDYHTCGLTTTGAAYCWGRNDDGQIGDGTEDIDRLAPTRVAGNLKFTSINSGRDHTCGLTNAGTAYCWGDNGDGELGDGTTVKKTTPTAVTGGLKFTIIDAGDSDTCALTSAGTAYCWGYDQAGSLGTGGTENANSPQAVIGGHTFISISAGDDHTCGLTTAGAAYCWGYNEDGELGDGTTEYSLEAGPRAVIGNLIFTSVMANGHNSGNQSCGITRAGDAYCWGYNGSGQLGDGTTDPSDGAGPQLVVGGLKWMQDAGGGICDRSSRSRERCRPTR